MGAACLRVHIYPCSLCCLMFEAPAQLAPHPRHCTPAMFYSPTQDVQRPTHPRLHVRDAKDAHTVFEAVRQGMLRPVVRRLNELERATYIQSGSIFVWEESDDEMGLKRWTDNRGWFFCDSVARPLTQ